jgi:ribokinase
MERVIHAPAASIHAVDTVGAGDAFACGYLLAWQKGKPFDQCLAWGNASGAWMASHRGVLGVLAQKNQIEQMLLKHGDNLHQATAFECKSTG